MPSAHLSHLSNSSVVTIEGVDFSYVPGERKILSGLHMEFRRGQVVAVMGGSGCGKTTVLRLIGGQVIAQTGSVKFEGHEVADMSSTQLMQARRRMGMLFQFGALFTDLSVFENVAFPLREHTNLSEELIHDLVLMKLNAVGLRGARDLMPGQISGGMARRVALARAIVLDPPLIMYDEPFAGLDPIGLGVTARLIRNLNDALGATSIIVTHDVEETFEIADYVYFIANGKIGAHGTPDELNHSADPFVRQFLDASPEGPVPFNYPGADLDSDFGLRSK
jgi:phospholipid/cholesterol/gamma-HCH transport system ATP-binding protein